jgi:hypothetical protein
MLLFPKLLIPASPFSFFIGYKVQGREVVCTKDVLGITSFPSPHILKKKLVKYVFVVGVLFCLFCSFLFSTSNDIVFQCCVVSEIRDHIHVSQITSVFAFRIYCFMFYSSHI